MCWHIFTAEFPYTLNSCPSPLMLQLLPCRQRATFQGNHALSVNLRKQIVGKEMTNATNTDAVVLIMHWELNHRLDFCPIDQTVLCVWRSCDWERRGGGFGRVAQVRPPPLLKCYLYSSGNTLYLPLRHMLHALTTSRYMWTIIFSSSSWTLGCISATFHRHCRIKLVP